MAHKKNNTAAQVEAPVVAEKAPRKTKPAQHIQNGVPQPREGTVGRKLWDLADTLAKTTEGGYKAIRLAVIQAAPAHLGDKHNDGNVRTEMSVWRRYNGIPKGKAEAPAAA